MRMLVLLNRRGNGYFDYADCGVHMLRYWSCAQGLGFSVEDCRSLVALYSDPKRKSLYVKDIALNRVRGINSKVSELQAMRATLVKRAENYHDDNRPDCQIKPRGALM